MYKKQPGQLIFDASNVYVTAEGLESEDFYKALSIGDQRRIFQADQEICALANPFMGEALSTGYSKPRGSFAYMGMENSGIFCSNPVITSKYQYKPSDKDDYFCL